MERVCSTCNNCTLAIDFDTETIKRTCKLSGDEKEMTDTCKMYRDKIHIKANDDNVCNLHTLEVNEIYSGSQS